MPAYVYNEDSINTNDTTHSQAEARRDARAWFDHYCLAGALSLVRILINPLVGYALPSSPYQHNSNKRVAIPTAPSSLWGTMTWAVWLHIPRLEDSNGPELTRDGQLDGQPFHDQALLVQLYFDDVEEPDLRIARIIGFQHGNQGSTRLQLEVRTTWEQHTRAWDLLQNRGREWNWKNARIRMELYPSVYAHQSKERVFLSQSKHYPPFLLSQHLISPSSSSILGCQVCDSITVSIAGRVRHIQH